MNELCWCGKPVLAKKLCSKHYGEARRRAQGKPPLVKHGMYGTPEYSAYNAARKRCTKPTSDDWHNYGARGIKFLFTGFWDFYLALGARPTPQHSLDRIGNDGNYEHGNVRWATKSEQSQNQHHPARIHGTDGRFISSSDVNKISGPCGRS